MKYLSLALIGLFSFACQPIEVAGQAECSFCRVDPYELDHIEKSMQCLTNHVRSATDSATAKESIRCALVKWENRDGIAGFIISDALLEMMEDNPRAFFEVMAGNEAQFNAWLGKLHSLSFKWFADPPSPLPAKLKHLTTFLSGLPTLEGEAGLLKEKVLAKLSGITPRQVD